MRNILKLYYRYLLSKEVCIILTIILILFTGGILYSSGFFEGYKLTTLYLESNQEYFIIDYLMISKLISLVLSVLLVIVLYTETSQNLRVFIIDSFDNKYFFYVIKAIFSVIVTILITLIIVSIFILVYNLFTPYSYEVNLFYKLFVYLLIQNLFYVFLTHFLISLLPNILIGFIPIVVFWYIEINFDNLIISESLITRSIISIFPRISLVLGEVTIYNEVFIYIIFIMIYVLSYTSLNFKKDIT